MINLVTIYALIDPLSNEVRYVGKTSTPLESRLRSHLSESNNLRKFSWVNELRERGDTPTIIELSVVDKSIGCKEEKRWIDLKCAEGCDLLNISLNKDNITDEIFPFVKRVKKEKIIVVKIKPKKEKKLIKLKAKKKVVKKPVKKVKVERIIMKIKDIPGAFKTYGQNFTFPRVK